VPPVVPAPGRTSANPQQLLALLPDLAGASLMTYDFSSQQAGPNAPLPWVADNVAALEKAAGELHCIFLALSTPGCSAAMQWSASAHHHVRGSMVCSSMIDMCLR
jgi:hypothetical protein